MQGGYLLCHHNSPSENHAAMVFSLYDTARRLAWLVKNMFVAQVLCISGNINHAVYELSNAVFSLKLDQNQLRLGMMRLLMTSVINDLNEVIRTAPKKERPSFSFNAPMVFKPQIRGTML
jgi:hypothetical protein